MASIFPKPSLVYYLEEDDQIPQNSMAQTQGGTPIQLTSLPKIELTKSQKSALANLTSGESLEQDRIGIKKDMSESLETVIEGVSTHLEKDENEIDKIELQREKGKIVTGDTYLEMGVSTTMSESVKVENDDEDDNVLLSSRLEILKT
ncbi:hypothetical protein HAX54_032166 [Datura stramonium]|uniref:Uncharacterized protein n=1 Tax=Datura stramonium TaxID=4076 RepID=A0ABS8VBN7_DATST|nr:hypothetical protein [Datura stramonium]